MRTCYKNSSILFNGNVKKLLHRTEIIFETFKVAVKEKKERKQLCQEMRKFSFVKIYSKAALTRKSWHNCKQTHTLFA